MVLSKILVNYLAQLFIQNGWNFRNEQRPGMTLVLSLRNRGKITSIPRNTVNTNPYLASFLAGVLVKERSRSNIEGTRNFEETTSIMESGLAAHGDDLYWRILRPTSLFVAMGFVLFGQPLLGLLVFIFGFNILSQGERLLGFRRGLTKGKDGFVEFMKSLSRIKRIILIVSGVAVGFLVSCMLFSPHVESFLFNAVEWFVFLPLFLVSLMFAFLRISPFFNLLANLLVVIVLGVLL